MTVSRDKITLNTDIELDILMSEGIGTVLNDVSRNHNPGAFTSAPAWTQLASGLWVLDFDGIDDIVGFGNPASLDINNALTIEAWVMFDEACVNFWKIGNITQWSSGYALYATNNTRLVFDVVTASGNNGPSTVTLSTATWYHAAGTFDSTLGSNQLKIYLNGAFTAQNTLAGTIINSASPFRLGRHAADASNSCKIGLPRVYSRALSAAEVYQRYQATRALFGV